MKRFFSTPFVFFLLILTLGLHALSMAQLRKDQQNTADLSGPVLKQDPSDGAKLSNLFNMQMDHSYSMMFSSYGGQMQNMNAYTNTMRFFFSDKLTGRVDLSLLHSPFGNNYMSQNKGMGTEFIIRNAELNYELSEKSNIRVQFQQVPNNYGPMGFGRNHYAPFQRNRMIFD